MGSKGGSGKRDDEVRLLYIDWRRMPKEAIAAAHAADKSFPKTKEQFAKKYHKDRTTLWRWEQEPEFKRDVADEALGLVSVDEMMKMVTVMKNKAMDGNVQAFNALMKIAGISGADLIPQQEDDDYFKNMTEEELAELAAGA
jgi:hypothetical protein